MKFGLIARAEDRGLGNLTREFFGRMQPDRTLVVRPVAADEAGLADHVEWYEPHDDADVFFVGWDPEQGINEAVARAFLDGLDVVYSAETFYDGRLIEWAREMRVRTVLHAMPEYFSDTHPYQRADVVWAPTGYRLAKLPVGTRVVPVPCPTHRFDPEPRFDEIHTPMTWLHPAGAAAKKDRNGTMQVVRALPMLDRMHQVIVTGQEEVPHPRGNPNVRVSMNDAQTFENYWDIYADRDAVIIPRKYGGLCMPALEAMAAGCALVMTDVIPQSTEWPIVPIPVQRGSMDILRLYGESIPIATAQPEDVAATMDGLAGMPHSLIAARAASLNYAFDHSWVKLAPVIREELAMACERRRRRR